MKSIKTVGILLVILTNNPMCWAQKKLLVQTTSKAIVGKPVLSAPVQRPYAQLLAQTQAFIREHNGCRPRACITNQNGLRISVKKLSEEQKLEFKLAGVISRTITAFKSGELPKDDNDLKELQTLVQQHPNPRSKQITPYLIKHRKLQREKLITDICQKATQYIQTHHKRPRSSISKNGVALTTKEIKAIDPQLYEEIHLGTQINSVLALARKYNLNDPQINTLKILLSKYKRK